MSETVMNVSPKKVPTREDVQARMDALLARLPARRADDLTQLDSRVKIMTKKDEYESMARLAALDVRVRSMRNQSDD